MGTENTTVESILQKFEDNLQQTCSALSELPDQDNADFDLNGFWTNFSGAVTLISHEATKFSMALEAPVNISIQACQSLVDNIQKTCFSLVAVFATLPKAKGKALYAEVLSYTRKVLSKMVNLSQTLKEQRHNRLQITGEVWEICEGVRNLPRDNRDAVLIVFREEHDVIGDASRELMESIEQDSTVFELSLVTPLNGFQMPSAESWSTSDRNVLLPSSGLIKAMNACIKKVMQAITEHGDSSNQDCINELDHVVEKVRSNSYNVDDLVLSLYPPMDHSIVREQATLIRNKAKDLLTSIKNTHICTPAAQTWIEFLEKAVDHNWIRIQDMALTD